jgi:hypothetical protein
VIDATGKNPCMASGVAQKLQIKDGQRVQVIGAPSNVDLGLPADTSGDGDADVVIAFVTRRDDIAANAGTAIEAGRRDGLTWIAYPKAGKLGTDLNRDSLNAAMNEKGLQAVRQIAIDEVWSALRFRPA